MVLDKDRGLIKMTDPMLGDKYFIKTPQHFIGELQIHCSRYGWLLMSKNTTGVMFYNPFTGDIRTLPHLDFPYIESFSFSAPPTSPDCTVVGLTTIGEWTVYIHSVSRDQSWRKLHLDFGDYSPGSFWFPTFFGRDIYILNYGGLDVFTYTKNGDGNENYIWEFVVCEAPKVYGRPSTKYYLTKSDQHLLLVFVDEFEKSVEVYKLNQSTEELEKLDNIEKYTIYVCDTTCLCFEAKTSKMENIIYFHHSYSENNKSVFYSLETREFHTFNEDMERSFGDLFKPKQLLLPHVWIEPSCS
ncbi:F-box/kelch-repeat protein At1g57790-like [Rutidosis leptorrhynchoides]|uniref:F-box/kelch-repeat protein At1g57790-like n=1 Tax=Rutidosis leptorrhynchoides TaxID=125765 RepID=UPI003A98FEF3